MSPFTSVLASDFSPSPNWFSISALFLASAFSSSAYRKASNASSGS
jgi:hypothetical protein